jgi:triosephosphate isomerase
MVLDRQLKMRTPLIAGNWKMNLVAEEAKALTEGLLRDADSRRGVEVVICPPFPFLEGAVQMTRGHAVGVGAQNLHHADHGAFTGEVSAPMLQSIGCTYAIVGHSERRTLFRESNADVNRKIETGLRWGLNPILCVGETLGQRREGAAFGVLNEQLVYGLQGLDNDRISRLVIAYEPVWAIGTGMSATSEQAQEAHRFIRDTITSFSDAGVARDLRIIYGGSVKPDNAAELLAREDVDGALVGGASLNADSFGEIVRIAATISAGVA